MDYLRFFFPNEWDWRNGPNGPEYRSNHGTARRPAAEWQQLSNDEFIYYEDLSFQWDANGRIGRP